jgi:hypothetical protein
MPLLLKVGILFFRQMSNRMADVNMPGWKMAGKMSLSAPYMLHSR